MAAIWAGYQSHQCFKAKPPAGSPKKRDPPQEAWSRYRLLWSFPWSRPPSLGVGGGCESLLRRCVGLPTVIIMDATHNRSERWDNIVSGGAAGERLNRTRLGIRVPGCSVAWGLGGLGPAICRGEFLLKERSRSIVAQTVAVGRCLEFLLLPFIGRIVTLYSSLWLFLRRFAWGKR